MRQFYIFLILVFSSSLFGQKAYDFTAKDIDGNEHNLFDVLSSGRHVLIDVSATWCGPCWALKQSGVMEDYTKKYGPEGNNQAMVYFVEGDAATGMDDLLGKTSASQGNWVAGTNFPIIDNAAIGSKFGVTAFPTLLVVCPDRTIKTGFSRTVAAIEAAAATCGKINEVSVPDFRVDKRDGCSELGVQFIDNSWPRPSDYLWDFGDGNTSSEKNPSHTYQKNGNYSVKLNVKDNFGENNVTKNDLVNIGVGIEKPIQNVGPVDKSFGTGKYFEGGHHALIVDVISPFVLQSVKVYSNREMERTFVLLDNNGEIVNSKSMNIPVGEHIIDLDFYFPVGQDFKFGMHSDAYLFRNDGKAKYPYFVDNVLSIKESTAAPTNPGYYYYYYDWKIRETGCIDVNAVENSEVTQFSMTPNPSTNFIEIDGIGNNESQMTISNHLGQAVLSQTLFPNTKNIVSIKDLVAGLYIVTIGKYSRKLVVE